MIRRTMGLKVSIETLHSGMTKNFNYYSRAELEQAADSWLKPYTKPLIKNHDMYSEPLGRAVAVQFGRSTKKRGAYCATVDFVVSDQEAMEKIRDGRYKTVSAGSSVTSAVCSICKNDWAQDYCEHRKGRVYEGKLCYWLLGGLEHLECSVVNAPADVHAQIIGWTEEGAGAGEGRSPVNQAGTIYSEDDHEVRVLEDQYVNDVLKGVQQEAEKEPPATDNGVTESQEESAVDGQKLKELYQAISVRLDKLDEQKATREELQAVKEQLAALSKQNVELARALHGQLIEQYVYLATNVHKVYGSAEEAQQAAEAMGVAQLRAEINKLLAQPLVFGYVTCPNGSEGNESKKESEKTSEPKPYTLGDLMDAMDKLLSSVRRK